MNHNYASSMQRLRSIMDDLRQRCPWDRKQTIQTLRQLTLEEVYELADAISAEDWQGLREELGDLLLHLVFYSKIAAEQEQFTFDDVIETLCNKLVRRHPHIYAHVQADDADQVKQNWEKIKLSEGKRSVLSGVPQSLPAMIKALRLQEKTRQVGFEWDHIEQVKAKVEEEMDELQQAISAGNRQEIEAEFGDLLFSLVNYARFLDLDPEHALEQTNKKFIRRFQQIETLATERGLALTDMSLTDMDALWNEIKAREQGR
jgi:MazG family protein